MDAGPHGLVDPGMTENPITFVLVGAALTFIGAIIGGRWRGVRGVLLAVVVTGAIGAVLGAIA